MWKSAFRSLSQEIPDSETFLLDSPVKEQYSRLSTGMEIHAVDNIGSSFNMGNGR